MGRETFPGLEYLTQYFLSKKTPSRIDLMRAILTAAQCAGLVTARSDLWSAVSTSVQHQKKQSRNGLGRQGVRREFYIIRFVYNLPEGGEHCRRIFQFSSDETVDFLVEASAGCFC